MEKEKEFNEDLYLLKNKAKLEGMSLMEYTKLLERTLYQILDWKAFPDNGTIQDIKQNLKERLEIKGQI